MCAAAAFFAAVSFALPRVNVRASGSFSALEEAVFVMKPGASVRLAENGRNGLRFTALMDKADYEALENSGAEIEYGMLICPYEYLGIYGPLTAENVFGENAGYSVSGEEGKARVMCLTAPEMAACDEQTMCFNGAIVDLLEENYGREFYGRGFIACMAGGTTKYKFAREADNRRSAAYVAQRALEEEKYGEEDRAALGVYAENFLGQSGEYTVRRYLENGGKYELAQTETLSGEIGQTVFAAEKSFEGYTLHEKKSSLSSPLYVNGRTVLDVYYAKEGEAEISFSADKSAEENVFDVRELFGKAISVNGVPVEETAGEIRVSNETLWEIAAAAQSADAWTVQTERRSYEVPVTLYDKIIRSFSELSVLNENPGGCYLLGEDVYGNGASFRVTEDFTGTFDGGGHAIGNIAVGKGLFDCVAEGGTVKNVRLKNVSATSAALAKEVRGRVENAVAESADAKYMVYESQAGAEISRLFALLKNGACCVNKSNGAAMSEFFGFLGGAVSDGLTGDNGVVEGAAAITADSLAALCEATADRGWDSLSAGADYVKFYGEYIIAL